MVYDLTMLKTFYAAYSEKIERVRNVLQRPMTLAEELQTGRRLCEFPSRPCGHAGCNGPNGLIAIYECRP